MNNPIRLSLQAPTFLETPRLVLRRFKESDIDMFIQMNQCSKVMEFMVKKSLSPEESRNWVERISLVFDEKNFGLWAMELKKHKKFIGYTGLWPAPAEVPFDPKLEIGWRLHPDFWGNGYVTEAAKIALKDGFLRGFKEIPSFTSQLNLRSIAVMERLGMTRDVDLDFDHPHVPKGHSLERHVLYRLKFNHAEKIGILD